MTKIIPYISNLIKVRVNLKLFYLRIFLLFSYVFIFTNTSVSQDIPAGCVLVDFETLPGQVPVEGLPINNQYSFLGITFELEGGGSPILSVVGPPSTAFGSSWGGDTPAPNQNIGTYFLTDDGMLSGLAAQVVIINFAIPADSVGGCILDMDFDEEFYIQARDEFGGEIYSQVIRAGDPNTGDGISTCWGFNTEGCEGRISSVRLEGVREQSGAFGLGLDNFIFCGSGVDILKEADIVTTNTFCDEENGTVTIIPKNIQDNFLYSIDGVDYQSNPIFANLEYGEHTIYIRDEDGCEAEFDIFIDAEPNPQIFSLDVSHTSCNDDNGIVEVWASGEGLSFSLDGNNFQDDNTFDELEPGNYTIYIKDKNECLDEMNATINPSPDLLISSYDVTLIDCNTENNEVVVYANGNDLMYSIDLGPFQSDSVFNDIGYGEHTIIVHDQFGCFKSLDLYINPIPPIVIGQVIAEPAYCGEINGIIRIENPLEDYQYSIDGLNFSNETTFENLADGNYTIFVKNQFGCDALYPVSVDRIPSPLIASLNATHTSCDEDNGAIEVLANGEELKYQINNSELQTSNEYINLAPGEYLITIVDKYNCTDEFSISINPSTPLSISLLETQQLDCDEFSNQISIDLISGHGEVIYEVDGNSSETNIFNDLGFGEHFIVVTDEFGCQVDTSVMLDPPPTLELRNTSSTAPDCGEENGSFVVNTSGGIGDIYISVNGEAPILNQEILNLPPGEYNVVVFDELGCEIAVKIIVPKAKCKVIVPNIISSNGDEMNDDFKVFTKWWYEAGIIEYMIFDRWGSLIYDAKNFSIHNDSYWWDGTFNGKPVELGVYVYLIKVRHENDDIEVLSGDVTVVR